MCLTSSGENGRTIIHAYDKIYLPSAMDMMGAMMDCAANCFRINPEHFHLLFLSSGIDKEIERGNPRFIAGSSGAELVRMVLGDKVSQCAETDSYKVSFGPEYWTGWVLCLLPWETGMRFKDIQNGGMNIGTILSLYPTLHEANSHKFIEAARERMDRVRETMPTRLKTLRKASGLTQTELAQRSGVSLRSIQSYEQRYLDISKAETRVVNHLAKVLGCTMEDLIQG